MAVAAAGSDSVIQVSRSNLENEAQANKDFGGQCSFSQIITQVPGEPIAVAITDSGSVIAQTRDPSALVVVNQDGTTGTRIALGGESVKDTGHDMFHRSANGFSALACASCHPEGEQDGRTWNFTPIGARRTQDISGGVLQTAPLHWDGDMEGLDSIMAEVFVKRMGGLAQGPRRIKAFAKWLDAIPSTPQSTVADLTAAERGKAIFNDAKVACASCHSGAKLTNNKTVDVGTGRAFQVPSLLHIADRAPFMHNGCAPTLRDRFSPACGGGDSHGVTSQLSPSDIDDLVAYLETL
jgi:mono/diheme cytochrome c family protein